jgi:aspartate 1-decarboxylase
MLLTMRKAKFHRAVVTQADLGYEGSIAIAAPRGSRVIGVNGNQIKKAA